MENALIYIGIAAVTILIFWWVGWGQAPKKNTQRLAITVWAAFGPYDTAQDAEGLLRTVTRIVLGSKLSQKDEEWAEGHIQNFHEWEKEGRFEHAEKIMRNGLLLTAHGAAFNEAVEKVRAEYVTQAEEGMEKLNKAFLEEGGHRLETVKHPDGKVDFVYKKIWSDEKIEQKKKAIIPLKYVRGIMVG